MLFKECFRLSFSLRAGALLFSLLYGRGTKSRRL